jgi:hypothetical protein
MGTWTANPAEALDFKTMGHAISFAEKAGLRQMELAFESHLSDFTEVPLAELRWGPSISKRYDQAA